MQVLDMGCGPGRLTLPAARRVGAQGAVVAVDIQPAMLERLERGRFDRAFLVTVLGEIHDRPAALAEIHAALKPGGLLSVSELIPDPHYQSRGRVERLAREAGFKPDRVFGTWLAFTANFVRRSGSAALDEDAAAHRPADVGADIPRQGDAPPPRRRDMRGRYGQTAST
jgi:ubiquinone/menaquinone biosynthesis C-methylase UbiE